MGDAYRVVAGIVTWSAPEVLRVPSGAVFQQNGAWQTYRYADGRARARTVRLGHANGEATEVLGGLQAGDRVIVYPGDKVVDGGRVTPMTVVAGAGAN
ncbi:MAG: hypothetical protein ACHQ4G_09890 [Opitutales bacterium]